MKNRSIVALPVLVAAFFLSAVCFGQTPVSTEKASDEPTVGRIDTGDSPIKLESRTGKVGGSVVTRKELTDENRVGYYMQNTSDKAIRAYSLLLVNGDNKRVEMALYPGIPVAAGEYLRDSYLLSKADGPVWTFDWVLFADGSTWGPDKFGRSREVLNFNKGREAAIAAAEEFAGPSEPLPVIRSLKGVTLRQWSINIPNRVKDADTDHFEKGFDSVIEIFTNFSHSNSDLARALAITHHLRQLKETGGSW